jgi:hypothetical protein
LTFVVSAMFDANKESLVSSRRDFSRRSAGRLPGARVYVSRRTSFPALISR